MHYTNTDNPIDFPKEMIIITQKIPDNVELKMPKNSARKLFLIEYESAHWAGASSNVVVWAESADEAIYFAESHMEDEMRELYSDEYGESVSSDEEYSDECAYSVISSEEFGPEHEEWKYFLDQTQSEFYPIVGKQ